MNVAVIQARMGSSRLPGKMMLPLGGDFTIQRVVERVSAASEIDKVVVATTNATRDDILDRYASRAGASVFRGSEDDVLDRMYAAASTYDPEIVVRVAGDRPLLPVKCIEAVVRAIQTSDAEYASNVLNRSFPLGFEAEAFTYESFGTVNDRSTKPSQREHVTPYYREHPEMFEAMNISSASVFDRRQFQDRTDLRLTLDEADDYELLRTVYEEAPISDILSATEAIKYIDDNNLATLNDHVRQEQWKSGEN